MEDAVLAAFSLFFTQSSFLAHQIAMSESECISNARTLLGNGQINSDNHIRNLLDRGLSQSLYPMFERIFDALIDTGQCGCRDTGKQDCEHRLGNDAQCGLSTSPCYGLDIHTKDRLLVSCTGTNSTTIA